MRRSRIVSGELFLNRVKRLFRFAFARDNAKSPVSNFLPAREPFVRPGEKNRSGQATFHHAVDVPAQHLRLLPLRMPDRVHTEFAEDKWMLAGEILQSR